MHDLILFTFVCDNVGFPPVADLAQLALSWKPRQSASTSSVYCQTSISGSIESCMPQDTPQPPEQCQQQKKKKQGRTISECLQLREMKAVTSSSECPTDAATVLHSSTMDSFLVQNSETNEPAVIYTSPAASTSGPHSQNSLSSSMEPSVQTADASSVNCSAAQRSQIPLMKVTSAAVCRPQHNVDNSHCSTASCTSASDLLVLGNKQHSLAISQVDAHTSSANPLTADACYAETICSLGRPSIVTSATVSSSRSLLFLPLSSAVVPTTAVPKCQVSEKVTSGTGFVDMDIGSDILGSGLVYGTFVYHGGRLVLGQQRQNNSPVSVWPLLPEVTACHSPLYFVAGCRPIVTPSANLYAVKIPSEALPSGLRVVSDGISNDVNDSSLPVNVTDIQSSAGDVETYASAVDGTKAPSVAVEISSRMLEEQSKSNAQLRNTASDQAEDSAGVPVTNTSTTDEEHVDGFEPRSSAVASVAPASSVVDSRQESSDAGITTAESFDLASSNNDLVAYSATMQAISSAGGPVSESSSVAQELPEITIIVSNPMTSDKTINDNRFVVQTCSVPSQLTAAVLSCVDIPASNSSSSASSAVSSADCSVRTKAVSGECTEIPLIAVSKQPCHQGVKRKPVSQSTGEYCSKTKIGRMDSDKRISKYICPPPDSASDKDSEIIHVMDRFCDKSLEQYLCPTNSHVSYWNATSQHPAAELLQCAGEDHVSVVNVLPAVDTHGCFSSVLCTTSASSPVQTSSSNHKQPHTAVQFSTSLSTKNLSAGQSQGSQVHLHDFSSSTGSVPSCHGKGFALANFLSTTTTPSMLVSSSLQQSSLLQQCTQTSKTAQLEKNSNSLLTDHIETQNHNFVPVNKMSNSTVTCDSASNILSEELSLTENDFAMILSDTDDNSMFSVPSRKSVDSNYWSFGSVCSRLRDRAKDGPGSEPLHASVDDLYHSFVPMFKDQNFVPESDYVMSEHTDFGSKVSFSVSSLTCKTVSVCRTSSSTQVASSVSNNTSSTLCQTSVGIPLSCSLLSQHNGTTQVVECTTSRNKLQEASSTQVSNVMCSLVQSSPRGIFSLAHHAIQPVSKSHIPNLSSSEVAQSASVLWSPCNGTAHKSSFSEHRQSPNVGRQCRLPSSAIGNVPWRMPEPSTFGPLYNSWGDNLYCTVQPLGRPFVDQSVNAQPGTCNMQSVFTHPKLHSISEIDHDKFYGRWADDDDFCLFVGNKNKPASSKHVHLNCQYSNHQKTAGTTDCQTLWTYSDSGVTPQPYLSTSRDWLPTNNYDTSVAITLDLSLNVSAPSSLPASTCRLPSFSFATVPPVPDFLSLSFASTAASTSTVTGTGVSTWPVTLTATTASSSAHHAWSPIFPQHAVLQSRHIVSTNSSFVASSTTVSCSLRQDTRPDVTYTVPSFIHADKQSRKQPSSLGTHLPSYTPWHGTEHISVEMCHLPPVSVINSDGQLLPIHGRGLYSSHEAGFVTNSLTSPPLHHHPVYANQQAAIYGTGEKQVMFETPFSLPRLPLTSQVLNFSASSFEAVPPTVRAISSQAYHDPTINVGNVPIQMMIAEEDARQSQNVSQSRSVPRSTAMKRPSKCPKQLKHNATSLCVGYPASHDSSLPQPQPGIVPTYLPAAPFVGGSLDQKSHSAEYHAGVSFGSVFGSCSLRHGLAGEFPKSLGVTATTDPQPNQRHNFDIGAFISELSSSSLQAVTAPAAIRRLDFPAPPVHVIQQPVGAAQHCQTRKECNQSASDNASHNVALHNMSINSLLGDNSYTGFTHRYEAYSETANHSSSVVPAFDVPTLNFSIRSDKPAVNFERPHNTKARLL